MGKVDKLDDIDTVPHILKHRSANGICQQRGKPLLQKSVGKQHIEIAAFLDSAVHFMLAAGYGENMLHAALDGIVQSIIRSGVAGVERDNHVDLLVIKHIARHIGNDKAQIIIAVPLGDLIAVPDHIFLEVVADDLRFHAALDREVIVQKKRQIRLAAAKVEDRNLCAFRCLEYIVHYFNKTVDLLILVVLASDDPEIARKHAEVDQRRNVLPFR